MDERTSEPSGKTNGAIRGLYLYKKRAQDVDAPARARMAVFLPPRRRGGDGRVNEPGWVNIIISKKKTLDSTQADRYAPVSALDIVIVTARTHTTDDEGPDGLDRRERLYGGPHVYRRQKKKVSQRRWCREQRAGCQRRIG